MEIDSPTDTFWKNGPGSLPEANQELLKAAGYLQSGTAGEEATSTLQGSAENFLTLGRRSGRIDIIRNFTIEQLASPLSFYCNLLQERTVGQSLVILL